MIWQDLIFLVGSVFSLIVLTPTLRNPMAKVPVGTSIPSAFLGVVYGATFFSLGMTLSATGSILTGILWSLIAARRSPNPVQDQPDSKIVDRLEASLAD